MKIKDYIEPCQIYYCCVFQTVYNITRKAVMIRHLPVGCKENSQRTVDVPGMKSRNHVYFKYTHVVHCIKNCFIQRMYFPSYLKTYCSYGHSTKVLQYPFYRNPSFIQLKQVVKVKRVREVQYMELLK